MALITLTFEDAEDGTVTFRTESDKEIPEATQFGDLSPAQKAAFMAITLINKFVFDKDKNNQQSEDESLPENGSGTEE